MQYKRTETRIGMKLPHWFRIERKSRVVTDGGVVSSESETAVEIAFPILGDGAE
jgi:hypothetical protein